MTYLDTLIEATFNDASELNETLEQRSACDLECVKHIY